jgi:hypothetical protein
VAIGLTDGGTIGQIVGEHTGRMQVQPERRGARFHPIDPCLRDRRDRALDWPSRPEQQAAHDVIGNAIRVPKIAT